MPRGASSAPNDRTSERTAAFVADRMDKPGVPILYGEEAALEVHSELPVDLDPR